MARRGRQPSYLLLAMLILACVLLTACTPDSKQTTEPSVTLPALDDPEHSDGQEVSEAPPATPDTSNTVAQTEGGPEVQPSQNEPDVVGTEPGVPDIETSAPSYNEPDPVETDSEFSGLDIEDDHTETIGENIGVGGN